VHSAIAARLQDAALFNLGPYPAARPGQGEIVGDLLTVSPEALEIMDRIEGHPSFFLRAEVMVDTAGGSYKAWIYWAPETLIAFRPRIRSGDWFARDRATYQLEEDPESITEAISPALETAVFHFVRAEICWFSSVRPDGGAQIEPADVRGSQKPAAEFAVRADSSHHQARAQLLGDLLTEKAGSPISINSLREDLEVSHRAVTNWLSILESFYYCFRIYPYAGKNFRSLKKEAKLYLWDWSEIHDESARFENCVASHLLKLVHFLQDYEGYKVKLNYLRSAEKKEVDFYLSVDDKPWFAVEAKLNDVNISPHLYYFKEKLNIPFVYQVIKKKGVDNYIKGVRVVSADRFLAGLI